MSATSMRNVASIGPLLYRDNDKQTIDTAGLKKSRFWQVKDRFAGKAARSLASSFVWGNSGACLLLNKQVLDEVAYAGGEYFDKHFFMYKEDVDLAARLRQAGYLAWFESTAMGVHDRTTAPSRLKRPAYTRYHSYKNHLYLLVKHCRWYEWPLVAPYELAKFIFLLIFDRPSLSSLKEVKNYLSTMKNRKYDTA